MIFALFCVVNTYVKVMGNAFTSLFPINMRGNEGDVEIFKKNFIKFVGEAEKSDHYEEKYNKYIDYCNRCDCGA